MNVPTSRRKHNASSQSKMVCEDPETRRRVSIGANVGDQIPERVSPPSSFEPGTGRKDSLEASLSSYAQRLGLGLNSLTSPPTKSSASRSLNQEKNPMIKDTSLAKTLADTQAPLATVSASATVSAADGTPAATLPQPMTSIQAAALAQQQHERLARLQLHLAHQTQQQQSAAAATAVGLPAPLSTHPRIGATPLQQALLDAGGHGQGTLLHQMSLQHRQQEMLMAGVGSNAFQQRSSYYDASVVPDAGGADDDDPEMDDDEDNRMNLTTSGTKRKPKGGVAEPFPQKLHRMLSEVEKEGKQDVISFFMHGRAFAIHKPRTFISDIMPKYFRMSRLSSFQRQLNLYGFKRITEGRDKGGYYHELFLKGRPGLCKKMKRKKAKSRLQQHIFPNGAGVLGFGAHMIGGPSPLNYSGEPNFYGMPPVQEAAVQQGSAVVSAAEDLLARATASSAPDTRRVVNNGNALQALLLRGAASTQNGVVPTSLRGNAFASTLVDPNAVALSQIQGLTVPAPAAVLPTSAATSLRLHQLLSQNKSQQF